MISDWFVQRFLMMEKMPERILIVRLSALGDVVLTLPLLFALRERLPGAHMGWVVDAHLAPILQDMPQLDRIHIWKTDQNPVSAFGRLIREIRQEGYQCSLDPQGLTRSAIVPFLSGVPDRVGFRKAPLEGRELAPVLTNRRLRVPGDLRHVSARSLYLGSALGLSMPRRKSVDFPVNKKAKNRIDSWWKRNGIPEQTLIFGVGAGWPTKIWPLREMITLTDQASKCGFDSLLLWGPQEKSRLPRWRKEVRGKGLLWAPETDIPEMIEMLRCSSGYAGPDSGPLHLAWLLGKPTFSWFGASDPKRCAPRGRTHAFMARGPHTWCRRSGRHKGLQRLSGAEVLPFFKQWIEKAVRNSSPRVRI